MKRKRLPRLPKTTIRVGILQPGGAHNDDGLTVGEIAEVHEFGLGHVPERSFIRAWFDMNKAYFRSLAADLMMRAYRATGSTRPGAELAALKARAGMQNRIVDFIPPRIADSTARRKERRGFPPPHTPLIETGVLKGSIDVEVVEK